jgi:hypothetical protein
MGMTDLSFQEISGMEVFNSMMQMIFSKASSKITHLMMLKMMISFLGSLGERVIMERAGASVIWGVLVIFQVWEETDCLMTTFLAKVLVKDSEEAAFLHLVPVQVLEMGLQWESL